MIAEMDNGNPTAHKIQQDKLNELVLHLQVQGNASKEELHEASKVLEGISPKERAMLIRAMHAGSWPNIDHPLVILATVRHIACKLEIEVSDAFVRIFKEKSIIRLLFE